MFVGSRQLAATQAQLDVVRRQKETEERQVTELREEKRRLSAELDSLRPLVDNYRALAASQSAAARDAQAGTIPQAHEVRPRVYLHVVDPGDRQYADGIGKQLTAAGFVVLGVEYVRKAAGLKNTEVRYYKNADEADARRLLSALREAGARSAVLLYLGLENNTRVRPRHYEIWFASSKANPQR